MNKTTTPRITIGMLRGACKEQRDIFRKEWPEGADVTIKNVRRARELRLNLSWGARWFTPLARKAREEARATAWKAYREAIAPALKAYDEAIAQAWKAYIEATAQAWKAYDEAQAWKAYDEAPALKAYDEAIAQAWLAAYLQSVAEREAAK